METKDLGGRVIDRGKWLIITYRPNSLFSLRMSHSTSSGGKTLFVPTPYAVKLAFVDAAFRKNGAILAEQVFDLIKNRDIRLCPPEHMTVNHTFIKIKREPKEKKPELPYISSIAFREFCFFQGDLQIAIYVDALGEVEIEELIHMALHINYFGKRGSFFQFISYQLSDELSSGFTVPEDALGIDLDLSHYGAIQFLDDLGDYAGKDFFERINSYSNKTVELGKHRILKSHFIPYKVVSSTKDYTHYRNVIK